MKTATFKHLWQAFGRAHYGVRLYGAVMAALLLASTNSFATTVDTLTGGWWQNNQKTFYGTNDGNTFQDAQFNFPAGLAFTPSDTWMLVADYTNNLIRFISHVGDEASSMTYSLTNSIYSKISRPVAIAVDAKTNIFYLNRGNGTNGTVIWCSGRNLAQSSPVIIFFSTNALASKLTNATALALDGLDNCYVTVRTNTIIKVTTNGVVTTVGVITNSDLRGITVMDGGLLALTDVRSNGIWVLNPANGASAQLTGFNGTGDMDGEWWYASFNHPEKIARAGGGILVVTDRNNHKVRLVDMAGNVARFYGVNSNQWPPKMDGVFPGWYEGPPANGVVNPEETVDSVEAREPFGVTVGYDGNVYTTEVYYHIIRQVTDTGLAGPGPLPLPPLFNGPSGIALDLLGTNLFIADQFNNVVERLSLINNQTTNFLGTNNGTLRPADVAVNYLNHLLVLNQGTGGNGTILEFDRFRNFVATNALGLAMPTAFTLDNLKTPPDLYVAESNGVVQIYTGCTPSGSNTVAVITNAGVDLEGIALFPGYILVSDAGNHVIWKIDSGSGTYSLFAGLTNAPGDVQSITVTNCRLNSPHKLVHAMDMGYHDVLVAADTGNDQLVVIGLDGAITNVLDSIDNALVWFGNPGDPYGPDSSQFVPMLWPVGVTVGPNGEVYSSEDFFNNIREITTNTGLRQFSVVVPIGTNTGLTMPTIVPNSGYYPMGRWITVTSSTPVFYTMDGSEPTTNSQPVSMTNGVGKIPWFGTTTDLTPLRVKAFFGTNSSATVSGQHASINDVGVPPALTSNPTDDRIYAGIGSTIVVPVVANLKTGTQIKSYQFILEIAPINNTRPAGLQTITVDAGDFIPLVTAASGNSTLNIVGQPISSGVTNKLVVFTNQNILFQNYAVVLFLGVKITNAANQGDTYSLRVINPSATSDGVNNNVPITNMVAATIVVTNVPYTVGDSVSASSITWYNAGSFGDDSLVNADVNNVFYASVGQHVPYTFSDVFNAMDTFPVDMPGSVGGDGQIRINDWLTVLRRSLGLDTNNWSRAWSAGGVVVNTRTNLSPMPQSVKKYGGSVECPWYHQALVGAIPVGNVAPGATVNVPVYVKLENGSTLSSLEFRALVMPQNGAPPLTVAPLITDCVAEPFIQSSFKANETAAGWLPDSINYTSRSSNFVGHVRLTIPATAQSGQVYTVSFTNADGSPDLNTQYEFETRSAQVVVNAPAAQASTCSDEWKVCFFGSMTNSQAADLADPDGDGIPNWMEYLAGTDPTDRTSKLRFSHAGTQVVNGKSQMLLNWLTAPGKAYEVQWSSSLVGGTWNTLGTVSGDGTVVSCPDTNTMSTTRYYRLHLLQ